MRDISIGENVDFLFTTAEPDTGAPATLSGTPVVSAYVGNSTTQITAGITLTADFDGVTGLNHVRVAATTGNGFADGTDVALIITTGTVDAVSAVGYKVGEFTIGRSAANTAIKPVARATLLVDTTIATLATQTSFTLTAGSADDDAYNGMAFIFTDVTTAVQKGVAFASDYTGSTKTVTLEAAPIFTIATTDLVTIVPAGSSTSVPLTADLADGAITAAKIASDAFTAAKFAADVTTEFQSGLATAAALATVDGNVDAILLDTAEIGAAGAGLTVLATQASVDTIDNFLDTEIAAILALLDDPRGEPGQGAPPVNPDLATKIDYLYKAWRNRSTQTATEYALYADDGTTKDHEAACSDDGTTFVRSEVTTGA